MTKTTQLFSKIILSLLVVTFTFGLLSFNQIKTEAASIAFSGGSVSINKYYLDGNSEVKTLTIAPGDSVTVRVKYANTGNSSATNVVVSDSLPSSKFTLEPGSIKNCLINSNTCQTLSDSLFTGLNLSVSPSSGYYGTSNNSVSGNLEFGKYLYVHTVTCSQTSGNLETFIQSINNSSIFSPSCASVSGSSSPVSNSTSTLLGQRYLHQTVCSFSGGEKEILTQLLDNTPTFTPDCSSLGGSATLDSSSTIDLLGQRYLHQTVCNQASGEKEIFTQLADNSASFTPDCSSLGGSATVNTSSTIDLLYSPNSDGYIEYKMQSNVVDDYASNLNVDIGDYGSNASLSSSNFITISDVMTNTLLIRVFCDQISPTGGVRTLTLSDAEVRAGQDFRCNYQASLCPVVFEDIYGNGIFDGSDTVISGTQVQLQTEDGSQTIDTVTTTSGAVCFQNLLHGRTYRLNIPTAPTGISTTGGDFKTQLITYQSTSSNVYFGYSNGTLILNVPTSVNLPSISVNNKVTTTSTNITPIQVIDTRLSNPGWSLTATVNDFVATNSSGATINVADNFSNLPGPVFVNGGQTGGVSIGNLKRVSSTLDPMTIFSGSTGSSKGGYQISTGISLDVPPFTIAAPYQTSYIYTII